MNCLLTVTVFAANNVVATYIVVNCRQPITLRDAPSVYAAELAQIPLGQAVGFIERADNGFYKIDYDELVGYALAEYLSPQKSVRTATVVNCKYRGVTGYALKTYLRLE